jgi:hypothetical protein
VEMSMRLASALDFEHCAGRIARLCLVLAQTLVDIATEYPHFFSPSGQVQHLFLQHRRLAAIVGVGHYRGMAQAVRVVHKAL